MTKTQLFFLLLAILLVSDLVSNVKESFEIDEKEIPTPSTNDDDQYILKSSIVPPVCPKCPDAAVCPRQTECPACPPCARCPEAPFTCQKVPNYNALNNPYLPRPVLNDFSQFGM